MKKETKIRSFSYLDVFLILGLLLVFSFAVYHFTEVAREKESTPDLAVLLSAPLQTEISFLPKEGEVLYAESGETYGSVESVTIEESGLLFLKCSVHGVKLKAGDEIKIETPSGICMMTVVSAEEIAKSAKGES